MADSNLFQKLIGALGDFIGWSHGALTDTATRRAVIADLGGTVDEDGDATYPAPTVTSITAYRDAAEPDLEGLLAALQDVRAAIDGLRGIVQTWDLGADAVADETLRGLLDLLATNYLRLQLPQVHYFMQLVSFAEDSASLYGQGRGTGERFPSAVRGLLEFLLGPLKTWNVHLADEADAERQSNRSLRLLAGFCAFMDRLHIDDTLYGWDLPPLHPDHPEADQPTAADAVLGRMLSLQFGPRDTEGRVTHAEQARLSLAWVPRSHGQAAMYLGLGGVFHLAAQLGKRWQVAADVAGSGVLNAMIGKGLFSAEGTDASGGETTDLSARLVFEAHPDADTGFTYDLSPFKGVSLQVGLIRLEAGLRRSDARVKATFRNGAFRLAPDVVDGFLGSLLPADGLRLPFDFAIGHSSEHGRIFEGQVPFAQPRPAPASLAATAAAPAADLPALPLPPPDLPGFDVHIPIGRALGPLKLHTLRLGLGREGQGAQQRYALELSTSLGSTIGPVAVRVEGLGLRLALAAPPGTASNLGLLDLDVGVRTPDGVALAVDARGLVTGGGFIQHDKALGRYAGVMELTLRRRLSLKAFGLLDTRLPDGRRGYSLVVFITADGFGRWPLGMGFWLLGIGGMLALHRTVDAGALRDGLKTGLLGDLLFPRDPVRRAPEILRSLATTFPVREGSHIVGVLARIGWGTPLMLWMDLAVMFEFGSGTAERLVVLGRVSSILPSRENDLLRLNMDALGIVDFDAGRVELDAALVDSRFAQRFVLTGAMALRLRWGTGPDAGGGFVLAVGGWNPHFAPPVNLPRLERVAIQLASGNNPRITCEAYFAITSNTVQFGSRASLHAEAHGFSIDGDIGFDVLVQLQPFHFLAEFHAGIQLRRGRRNLFKVTVAGALEGPRPLRVRAKASFEIFWCDFSVHFDRTLVAGAPPPPPPAVDGLALLVQALAEPQRWQVLLPEGEREMVVLRPRPASAPLALHPLGRLRVTQSVLPLHTARDIDVFGGAPVAGARRFGISAATLNGAAAAVQPLREAFALGQFFTMDDEDRIARPSFEAMDAGVVFGNGTLAWPAAEVVETELTYDPVGIDDNGNPLPPDEPAPMSPRHLSLLAGAGAVADAPVRQRGSARFRTDAVAPAFAAAA